MIADPVISIFKHALHALVLNGIRITCLEIVTFKKKILSKLNQTNNQSDN